MSTVERKQKFNAGSIVGAVESAILSPYFPFVTAIVTLACYYLSLDMAIIWYMALCGAFILVFSRDASPLITLFLFMNIMISMKNTPTLAGGNQPSDYYFQTHIVVQIGVAIGLFGCAGVYRMIRAALRGQIKRTPTLFGLCAFAAAIMLNGLFSEGYTAMNVLYGFFMAFMFLGVYAICSGSAEAGEGTFSRIAWAFVALSVCLVIELAVAYATYDGLWLESGGIERSKLYFGWGMYNTMGMLLTISMPAAAWLAVRHKFGNAFTAWLVVLEICVFVSLSRQAMLCGTAIFAVCVVWILLKTGGRARWINCGIFAAAAVGAAVALGVNRGMVDEVIAMLTNNFFSGSGRDGLYEQALNVFFANPVFGNGFYRDLANDPGFIGLSIMPDMYHNTVLELLAAGGLVAFVPYVVHRMHTVISFVKDPSENRFFVGLVMFALIILSLLDNHMFYILPTLVYSYMTAVLIKSEGCAKSAPACASLAVGPRANGK